MSTPAPTVHVDAEDLRSRVRGQVALPGDQRYQTVSFNAAVPIEPWATIDVADAVDIAQVMRFASENSMTVAVHGTGHGAVAVRGDTLLIRTGALDVCEVDRQARTARIGAGVRWQTVIDRAAECGLAPAAGSAPGVGVAGFLSGGGIGPLVRTIGVSSDLVRSFEVITGDGRIHSVDATHEPELFWALRGGKSIVGVISEVVVDLLPITEFYGGAVYFGGDDIERVASAWQRWVATLPRTASTSLALLQLPEMPGVPPQLAGRMTLAVRFACVEESARAAALFAPIRDAGDAILDGIGPMSYSNLAAVHADPADPMPVHERTALLREMPAEVMAALLRVAGPRSGSPQLVVEVRLLGGAVADEPRIPSAFCHREAAANLSVIGVLAPPVADHVADHAGTVIEALGPWTTGGELPNFGAATDLTRMRRCYDEDTYAWLRALAAQHDPDGVLATGAMAGLQPTGQVAKRSVQVDGC